MTDSKGVKTTLNIKTGILNEKFQNLSKKHEPVVNSASHKSVDNREPSHSF